MGGFDEDCDAGMESLGIREEERIEEMLERLHDNFFAAIDAGDQDAGRLIDEFEASLGWLPASQRHEIVAEASVWLTDELKMRRSAEVPER